MTNVITVYQPYASLIMAGVKTWETRGNPPNGDMRPEGVRGLPGKQINRGDRVAIHAAKRWAPGWVRWYNPDRKDADLALTDALEEIGVEFGESDGYWYPNPRSLPTGVILGSVRVDGAIPIRTHLHNPHLPKLYDWCAWVCHETDIDKLTYEIDGCPDYDITDQLPYGHWLPGNWAWELADPIPTTEQCPACDGDGWYIDSTGSPTRCYVCETSWTCPPIPAKGKQGVWEWKEGTGMQTKVRPATVLAGPPVFAHAMRAARLHVGMGGTPVCVTCGEEWPCSTEQEDTRD